MATLADKTYQDSRTMRIATLVAMFYLPANLVMSFFSTILVWYESADGVSSGDIGGSSEYNASLRIHREMWIAVLTTFILTTCTLAVSWWWERREKQPSGSNGRIL
ncbi:hypothetical protein MGN70_003400 [Eutypa lata]|nr:hypothetical protein MGN70_003400 [Eutypa lata]